MKRLSAISLLLASLGPLAGAASAAQYEAVLLPERSLRYQNTFGLFADDYEGFIQPRRNTRWDADRLVTQLTNLAPEGNAALGYGNASTDAWSWTVLGSGGYRYESGNERVDSLRLLETEGGLLQTQQSTRLPGNPSLTEGQARLALGLGSELGGGQFGIGLQALWNDVSVAGASNGPGLFTFQAPENGVAESTELSQLVEGAGEGQRVSLTSEPRTETESLRAGVVAGYLQAPREKGWGWGVDVLGGVERLSFLSEISAIETVNVSGGVAETGYLAGNEWSGTSPFGGVALTLMRLGSGLTYFDFGGEYAPGVGLSGVGGETTGSRRVAVTTGGLEREYLREERRVDVQSGTVGERLRATAGFRHITQIDPLLQLGWGLNVTWRQTTDTQTLASSYEVTEFFDADGDGTFSDGDTRAQARGQTSYQEEQRLRELDIRVPLALMMLSEDNAGLEWRIGSELRYRNLWRRQAEELTNVVVPSGRSYAGSGESSPTRYGNALLPAGGIDEARVIDVTATLRAGAGYWFARSAKIDFVLSAEPAGEGFIDLSDPAFGVSALLVF